MTVIAAEQSGRATLEQTADNDEPPSDPQETLPHPRFYFNNERNRSLQNESGPVRRPRLFGGPFFLCISKK